MIIRKLMAKLFFIILILCHISITISYDFNGRLINIIGNEESEDITNNTSDSSSSSNIDQCIPVQAVKELGCLLSNKTDLFKGLFQSVCEQYQLCYVCGFAHGITVGQCNRLALVNMYELCFQNKSLPFTSCLKQRFIAIKLLRQHVYRSASTSHEFFFECHQQCVFDYLNAI